MLKKIAALVQAQGHLVMATCSPDGGGGCDPHASLMCCCASPDGREFWLATLRDTRKYANLRANPCASLLLDDRVGSRAGENEGGQGAGPSQALTVQAVLLPFASADDEAEARRALLARHPEMAEFLALPDAQLLRLVGVEYELVSALTEVFRWSAAEKP